jgi:glutathione S-transferase
MSGPNRTLADVALFPFIRQFANHNRSWFDEADLPHLRPWLEAHLASDLFASIMPKFKVWQTGDEPVCL